MIEALIRDDIRLICLITIQPGPDKESLNVDLFTPGEDKTLSGVMPAGGEATQLVARAIMTVFPVSDLPKPDLRPASQIVRERKLANKKINEEVDKKTLELDELETTIRLGEREFHLRQKEIILAKKLRNEKVNRRLYEAAHGPLPPEMAGDCRDQEEDETLESPLESFQEQWALLSRRMASLDKREAEFNEREKKLAWTIRKSHPGERR